jgi:hypothetical protein
MGRLGETRALYLKALTHYREQTLTSMREMFASVDRTRDGFSHLLLGLCAETLEQHAGGCLLRDNQASVGRIFADAIRSGPSTGELSKAHDPQALARFFSGTLQGMR